MKASVSVDRLAALSDFMGPPAFNGWACLVDSVTGARYQPIAVPSWSRTADGRGIRDSANLVWIAESDLTYDGWGLAVSADAMPFLWLELGQRRAVRRGETVEIAASLSYYSLA